MFATGILIVYILLFLMEFSVSWFLSILNLGNILKNRTTLPEIFKGTFSQEKYELTVEYNLEKGRFGLVSSFVSSAFLLLIIVTGSLGRIDQILGEFIPAGYIYNILYIFIVSLIFSAVSSPFSLYSQFYIEEKYGFNKTTLKTYLSDMAKQIIITPIIAIPLLLGLFFFMDKSGSFWWIYATGFLVAVQFIMIILYPVLIAPLFNKFTPLEDGELKTRLLSLAGKTGFKTNGIFMMDGSKRSSHSNAYFTGFGKSRRIVLFDTLIDSLSVDELEAVLAHEIGHFKKKHIPKRLLFSILSTALMFFIINLLMGLVPLYQAFGFTEPGYHAILIILSICLSPLTLFLSPLSNGWSRKHEYEADRFARDAVGGPEPMKSALLKLGSDNMSNLTPHRAYSFFHYSHPALSERLAALNTAESGEPVT